MRQLYRLLLLVFVLVLLVGADLVLGSVRIPFAAVISILGGDQSAPAAWSTIVWDFRLPRALTAIFAGSALAVAGLLMQTLFRNPLAGPYVLGISGGASLGVALVVLTAGHAAGTLAGSPGSFGQVGLVAAASTGALAALALVLLASRWVGTLTLLVLGVLLGYATSALVTVLVHFSDAERIQAYVVWTFGSFGGVTWSQLRVLGLVVAIGATIAGFGAKSLNALILGHTYARSIGLEVRAARFVLLSATALLAGGVTAFCGPIGFLGVAVPHLARGWCASADHRLMIPAAAVCGAVVAVFADIVAQLPGQQAVLPLNAVTALIGAPVIAAVIIGGNRRGSLEHDDD